MLTLTDRQCEVLSHVALGLSNKEIASTLYITVNTVKLHLNIIFQKLNTYNRTHSVITALKLGLIKIEGLNADHR